MATRVGADGKNRASHSGWWMAGSAAGVLFLISLAYALAPGEGLAEGKWRLILWLVILVLLTVVLLAIGYAYSGHLAGILISRQNRVSLSQTQTVIWSILFASAALALLLIRLRDGVPSEGLVFEIPMEAAALLGISTVSFGTAAGIRSAKRGKDIPQTEREKARRAYMKGLATNEKLRDHFLPDVGAVESLKLVDQARTAWQSVPLDQRLDHYILVTGDVDAETQGLIEKVWREMERQEDGLLFRNLTPKNAHPRNLVEGDEYTNAAHMDLGKLQMLVFALIAIIGYTLVLGRFFLDGAVGDCVDATVCMDALPGISAGLVGILGASHVGYLTTKAAGATKSD